jgi:MipA family protein
MGAERGTEKFFKGVLLRSRTDPWLGVDASRGRFFLSTLNGLGYLVQDSETFSLGVSANYMLGRSETYEPRYRGLGKVEATLGAYGFFEWRPVKDAVTVYGNVLRSSRTQSGTLANLGATLGFPLVGQLSGFVDYNVNWADSNYTQTYYGVTAAQAATSGYTAYNAKGGLLNATPTVGLYFPINKQWSVLGYGGKARLAGAAGDSPVVQNRSQSVGALLAVYKY